MVEEFDYEMLVLEAEEELDNVISRLKSGLIKIRTGAADPTILEGIKFSYYGEMSYVSQMCQITIPEARQLLIKPYDLTAVGDVVSALRKAQLGIEPANEGERIRLTFPMMTEEIRRKSAKGIGKYKEEAKIGVRNIRQDVMKNIKRSEESDDSKIELENDFQKMVVSYNNKIDIICKDKEEQVMKI